MSKLILHCGGQEVTRQELKEVPTPLATQTWFPIDHNLLMTKVEASLQGASLKIKESSYGLSHEGKRFFGVMEVAPPDWVNSDYGMVVGVRNSHDQSFAASLALGSRVFVCDNLAFSGEITLARRHTRHIQRDLEGLTMKAVGHLTDHRKHQEERIAAYKEQDLDDTHAHHLIIKAVDVGATTPTKIPLILKEWREPTHEVFQARTVWSLFNCFTEITKQNRPETILARTQALHGLMDSYCGVAI